MPKKNKTETQRQYEAAKKRYQREKEKWDKVELARLRRKSARYQIHRRWLIKRALTNPKFYQDLPALILDAGLKSKYDDHRPTDVHLGGDYIYRVMYTNTPLWSVTMLRRTDGKNNTIVEFRNDSVLYNGRRIMLDGKWLNQPEEDSDVSLL